ncbi:MAG: hypothetical protein ACYDEO_28155, partial [Aggregatilineales bacterium]
MTGRAFFQTTQNLRSGRRCSDLQIGFLVVRSVRSWEVSLLQFRIEPSEFGASIGGRETPVDGGLSAIALGFQSKDAALKGSTVRHPAAQAFAFHNANLNL